MPIVPPGGFRGFAQMTSASQHALSKGVRGSRGPSRRKRKGKKGAMATYRRKRKAASAKASGRKTRKRRKGGLPKFGSPAWRKKFKLG